MEYILIGKIVNTHGINGELKVESYTDFYDERFKKGTKIYIGENHLEFEVKQYRLHKNNILIKLVNNEDINLVEKYKNSFIYKSSDDIKPLKNGEYYFRDLKGLDVYQNGILIGKVKNCEEGNRYNFLRITVRDKERLIPFIEQFILNVDLNNSRIDIVEMEGLLWK